MISLDGGETGVPEQENKERRGSRFSRATAVRSAAICTAMIGAIAAAQCPPGPMVSLFPAGPTSYHQNGFAVAMDSMHDGTLLAMSGDIFFGSGSTVFGGAAFIFKGTPDGVGGYDWTEEAMLAASDVTFLDISADAVALDASGEHVLAVVGSQKDDHLHMNAGSAAVFARGPGGAWSQEALLIAPDAGPNDYFGNAVAVHQGTVVVGVREGWVGGSRCGTAYFFVRAPMGGGSRGVAWNFALKVSAPDASAGAWFGQSVSCDGDWAAVGAPRDDQGQSNAGSVYLYRRTGPLTWALHSKLLAPDALANDGFGWSVSLSGGFLVVGAPAGGPTDIGSAYIFRRDDDGEGGADWSFEALLTPLPGQGSAGDRFGGTVSVRDGLALIGANGESDPGFSAGSAYLFRRGAGGAWTQSSKIRHPNPRTADDFGWTVALARGWALIGAPAQSQYGPNWGNTFVLPAPAAPVVIVPPADASPVEGESFVLSVEAAGRGPWSYQWFMGAEALSDGGRISGSQTAALMITGAELSDAGVYRVEISNDCGTSSAQATVTVVPPASCKGDANGDGVVNFADITSVLANFGMEYSPGSGPGDANGDGIVTFADVTSVLANWAFECR